MGGDYKIFKNTLVRRAIDGGEYQLLSEYLSGPSALTFVQGDISAVAKALRDFSRANPHLVIKGGLADGSLLSTSDLAALADLPPREVLLARLAGALAAPMQQMAGLLLALPQNLAYGISALIEQKGGVEEAAPPRRPRPLRRRRRTRPRQPHPKTPEAADARSRRTRGRARPPRRNRWRPPRARAASPRRRTPQKRPPKSPRPSSRTRRHTHQRPTHPPKTEGKKGRPRRWQP